LRRKFSFAVAFFIACVIAYYTYAIANARSSTPEILKLAESKIAVPIPASDLTQGRLKLLLKVQDENFFEHGGTDFTSGRITTITQGLVKFLYFDDFKPGLAKIEQSLLASFALDPLASKEKQLFLFLSLAYMGHYEGQEIRGFGQASQIYFGKEFPNISDDEYLSLLVMLAAPNGYNIKLEPQINAEKVSELKRSLNI